MGRRGYGDITPREIIVSISIIAVMIMIGFFLSGEMAAGRAEQNAEYFKAVHITDPDLFQYGMDTSVGHAFVFGKLQAVDTVSLPEVEGEWLYIEKVEEHYNRHERTVTKTRTNADGKTETYTEIEVYYSWDYHDSWEKHSEKITFCSLEFPYGKIKPPGSRHIKTDQGLFSSVRFKYYVCDPEYEGTIYTDLQDGGIPDRNTFYNGQTIEETLESKTYEFPPIIFWIIWLAITLGAAGGFCYLDNEWLEN